MQIEWASFGLGCVVGVFVLPAVIVIHAMVIGLKRLWRSGKGLYDG